MSSDPVAVADSAIEAATLAAYRATRYAVHDDPPIVLRIDEPSPALAALHARFAAPCSAYLTAWNPLGEASADAENEALHAALVGALDASGHAFVHGVGRDPTGEWPGEASLLVPGMALVPACELAARFGQNAFVWSGADAIPRLILLR